MSLIKIEDILVPKFLPLYEESKEVEVELDGKKEIIKRNNYILISGRNGGKTRGFIQKMFQCGMQYPNLDIQVLRANSSSLKESVFLEFKKYSFDKLPVQLFNKITWHESPPLLITLPNGNQIRFGGVGLGSKSSSNQSRGKTAERKFSLIVVEETQEIFSGSSGGEDLLNHAINTYIRNLDDKVGKIIYAGNRERNINSKYNVWVKSKEKDPSYQIIETSWLDIKMLLNKATVRMIQIEKELNPTNYRYLYMGEAVGGSDLVYHAFTENRHVLSKQETKNIFEHVDKIYQVLIGVDGSSTVDVTSFMPIFRFMNNKMVLRSKDIVHHNPKINGTVNNAKLTQFYIRKWLQNLITEYSLQYVPIVFVVDGHNGDLIDQLKYEFQPFNNVTIIKYTHKDLVMTSDRVNNAFQEDILYITDEDFVEMTTQNPIPIYELINELQTVCWLEDDSTKFNDSIPNDMTDGIRYPISWVLETPYQQKKFSE